MRRAAVAVMVTMMAGLPRPSDAQTCCEKCATRYGASFCNAVADCIGCNTGFYLSSQCGCTRCPAGSKCSNKFSAEPCPAGSYQSTTGQSACLTCTAGTNFQDQTGQAICKLCSVQTCSRGYRLVPCTSSSNGQCRACEAGKYTYTDSFNHAFTECTPCSASEYQSLEGQMGCNAKTVCQTGQYTIPGSSTTNNQCVACTCSGETYKNCPGGGTANACAPCRGSSGAGFCAAGYQPSLECTGAQTSDATCVACVAGKYKPSNQQKMCDACPTGSYASGPSATGCAACTNNAGVAVYQAWGGAAASTSACPFICIAGYYKSGSACVACNASAGRYSSVANVTGTQYALRSPLQKTRGTESLGLSSVCVLHQQAQQQLLPTAAAGGPGVQRHDQRLPVVSLDAVRW